MANTITGADLLTRYPKGERMIQIQYKAIAGQSFSRSAIVSPAIIAQLDAKWLREKGETKAKTPRKSYAKAQSGGEAQQFVFSLNDAQIIAPKIAPPAQEETSEGEISQEKMAVEIVVFCALCIVIVEVHALLIWYDAFKIWKAWGLFGGAIAFAFQNAAILLASNKKYTDLSEWPLLIVGLIDAASLSLHIPCFTAGSGRSTVDVSDILTIGFCIFIVGFSYASFALFRAVKNR